MNYRIFPILFFALVLHSQNLLAQERQIIKLNQFMVPIQNEANEEHLYNLIISENEDQIISKTYDLQNRLLIQTKENFKEDEGVREEITSTYDTLQNLISSEIKNLDNGSFVKVFLEGEKVISKLTFLDGETYQFFLGDMETPKMEGKVNPLLPKPLMDEKAFFKALSKNLDYPQVARNQRETGTVMVGMLVDESGKVTQYYCLNPENLHPSLVNEAIRCLRKIDPAFEPGLNHLGEPDQSEFRIPIRFTLD